MKLNLTFTWLAFLASLAILISLFITYQKRFNNYVKLANEVDITFQVITTLKDLEYSLQVSKSHLQGFQAQYYNTLNHPSLVDSTIYRFHKLKALTTYNKLQQQSIIRLEMLIENYAALLDSMPAHVRKLPNEKTYIEKAKETIDECKRHIANVEREELKKFDQRNKNKKFYEAIAPSWFNAFFLFAILTFIISFLIIIQQFRKRLKNQKQLEQKVIELNQSNSELEQIAYLASHDLQEPLRKISTFSDRLAQRYAMQVDEEGKRTITRINIASDRMRDLVKDLAKYVTLIQPQKKKEKVDLNQAIQTVVDANDMAIKKAGAQIQLKDLPALIAHYEQIHLMFECLLDNSLKFSREGESPRIQIFGEVILAEEMKLIKLKTAHSKFVKIVFRDNGIGFDNEFADGMFGIFKRLHPTQSAYEGKGLGLAIVKRVISNHNGMVLAKGKPMEGAEFLLYFPTD